MSEWQPIDTAPIGVTVITYGAAGIRFMRKDEYGQWRNMMHRGRDTPTHWRPLPAPPATASPDGPNTPAAGGEGG